MLMQPIRIVFRSALSTNTSTMHDPSNPLLTSLAATDVRRHASPLSRSRPHESRPNEHDACGSAHRAEPGIQWVGDGR